MTSQSTQSSHLPDGTRLVYGTATASYQVEGSTTVDGRGPSIWDTFTARPGTIKDASDGTVACASYERLDEDLELLAGLGVTYYRFSVAWPRVQPTGSGAVEPRGLAYYDRLVDDQDRIAYLRDHVAAVERARTAGADVRAYVAWTLLDNFEWAEGYTKKFGLVEVSPADPTRTPKASYLWYSDLVHAGPSTDAVR